MKKGYRNCHYDYKEKLIYLRTWDVDGNRVVTKHIHDPYLFVKANEDTGYVSIFGDDLKKMSFDSIRDRNSFVDTTNVDLFYNLPVEQQFLLDYYKEENFEDLLDDPLKVVYIDIECPSSSYKDNHSVTIRKKRTIETSKATVAELKKLNTYEYEVFDEEIKKWSTVRESSYIKRTGGFPDPEKAQHPVDAIGCWDTLTNKYHVFGIGPYNVYSVMDHCKNIDPLDIEYINCVDEMTLFKRFLRWWRSDFPDVIVSWNGFTFDIPYIIHRMNKLFGEDKACQLSPYESITFKDVVNVKGGNTYREYTIKGITHLDYMFLYKTLKPEKNLDSFTLDSVANEELNDVAKVDLDGLSHYELSVQNHDKYISYNIQDVNVIRQLDNKLRLIQLTRFLCTMGFSNFDKVYGKSSFIAGMFARRSLEKGRYMATRRPEKGVESIPGGHVKKSSLGLREDVIYFDANSLYPNTIISLNISPETKRGFVIGSKDNFTVTYQNKKTILTRTEFMDFIKEKNLTLSGSGHLFTKDFMGVLPEFCDFLYKKRVEHKGLMLKYEKESTKFEKDSPQYNSAKNNEGTQYIIQNVYKTVMNSCYGVLVNAYFPLYDRDCGISVTLSGQKIIKKTFDILNQHMRKETGMEKDFVVCGDTDSVAVELHDYLALRNLNIYNEEGFINDTCRVVETELSEVLNNSICDWVRKTMFSEDVRYQFKRETVCKNALFIAGKNYCLNVVNKEGVDQKKTIVKGNLNRAVCSKPIKKMCLGLVNGILLENWNETKAIEYFHDIVLNSLKSMSIADLAIRINIKDYEKYGQQAKGLVCASKTPGQHKAAICYNYLLDQLGLTEKYRKVVNGTKIQIVQVKENKWGITSIGYITELPPEFGLEIDVDRTADKSLVNFIKPIYGCLGWNIPDLRNLYAFNINDLF